MRKVGFGKTGFSQEVREAGMESTSGYCVLCEQRAVECHHRISNSVVNNRRYPRFVHSVFNLAPLCRSCHVNRTHELRITEKQASCYEWGLVDMEKKVVEKIAKKIEKKFFKRDWDQWQTEAIAEMVRGELG